MDKKKTTTQVYLMFIQIFYLCTDCTIKKEKAFPLICFLCIVRRYSFLIKLIVRILSPNTPLPFFDHFVLFSSATSSFYFSLSSQLHSAGLVWLGGGGGRGGTVGSQVLQGWVFSNSPHGICRKRENEPK